MGDKKLIITCLIVLFIMVLSGGGLIISGLAIGMLTSVAFLVLAFKCPPLRWFARHCSLLADLMATVVAYLLFPPGVTAFIGAGVVALVITLMISVDRIMNTKGTSHTLPNDFGGSTLKQSKPIPPL